MKLDHYAITDVGLRRKNNEDSVLVNSQLGLYVLSDGMGGHAGGEVASKIAVEKIQSFFAENRNIGDQEIGRLQVFPSGVALPAKKLIYSVMLANQATKQKANKSPGLNGMGSTVVAVHAAREELYLGHVGDSRIYLYRNGLFKSMTVDHSVYNEELKRGVLTRKQLDDFPYKNRLARALGHMEKARVDIKAVTPRVDDLFLLCSDGLTDMVDDDAIREIIALNFDDLKAAGDALVEKAKENGGRDNISIILIKVSD